ILASSKRSPEQSQQAIQIRMLAQNMLYPKKEISEIVKHKFKVIVTYDTPDLNLDNCINSLLNQNYDRFSICCLSNKKKHSSYFNSLEEEKLSTHQGYLASAIQTFNDEAILIIPADSCFIYSNGLSIINQQLNERDTLLFYGQHLFSNGTYGDNFPLTPTINIANAPILKQKPSWLLIKSQTKVKDVITAEMDFSSLSKTLIETESNRFFIEHPLFMKTH
ncbi:MAG: hypothetical protein JKY48_13915, partial [Flavobacteriales bacterium]|nr:hypothetical protein [Flavobacteriales bacterium]